MSTPEKTMKKDSDSEKNADGFMRKFMAPEGVVKSRLVICSKCEHYNQTTKMCSVCHCVMPFKTRIASMKCPKGKWLPFVRPPKPDGL